MLQVAVERLSGLWPAAAIDVITDDPDRLRLLCPTAWPLLASGRRLWFEDAYFTHTFHRLASDQWTRRARHLERTLRRRRPKAAERIIRVRATIRRDDTAPLDEFLAAVSSANLVLSTGAGAITDAFASLAITILDLLAMAKRRGATTALLGHGVGPIRDRVLLERAREVLPQIDLIALREGKLGVPLLASLGVDRDRAVVTGDDAVELAYRNAPARPAGRALGFNVRIARYSEVDRDVLVAVAAAVRSFAQRAGAAVVPIPISWYPREVDARTIAAVLEEPEIVSDPPALPADVVATVARCRVVVTGSYHAAVFALAQGIPAVCISRSSYYDGKFLGLADEFEVGVRVVRLREDAIESRLGAAIDEVWATADELRPHLLDSAKRQIDTGRSAYRRLAEIVSEGACEA
jgi:polysaccharide pyruvyl transferase WcaK-like protein